jgi:predicted esterase
MLRLLGVVGLLVLATGSLAQEESAEKRSRPMTPGVHLLQFEYAHDGQTETRSYAVYLPRSIEQAKATGKKFPVVLSLVGLGARGLTHETAYREGPIQLMRMKPEYEETVPYIVVRPMIAPGQRSDNPVYAKYAVAALRDFMQDYPVDPKQVHLSGLSMGGETVWHVALEAPELFTTVSSIMGRQHDNPELIARTLKNHTVFIAVGVRDREAFVIGSRAMRQALEKEGVDLVYVEVPNRGHDIWIHYVLNPRYYEWLLLHKKGEQPKARAGAAQMLRWTDRPTGDPRYVAFSNRLQRRFHQFQEWWFIEHCGMTERVGPQRKALGKRNVFVTYPRSEAMPCRILFTAKVPKGKRTTLNLEVGHVTGSAWELVVNIDGFEKLNKLVGDPPNAESNWRDCRVDLTPFAGKSVQIELLHKQGKSTVEGQPADHHAYWRPIEIVSK